MSFINNITNFVKGKTSKKEAANAYNNIFRAQLTRTKQDISKWREALREAENVWYPHRVKMMQLFQDTILNSHVEATMERRKDLTLLKDFKICSGKEVENEELTQFFKKQWFSDIVDLILDAKFFGYSAIQILDIINNEISGVRIIRRENISPDLVILKHFEYSTTGPSLLEEPLRDWVLYVDTPNQTGSSICGFGLLYKVAFCEIFLRNSISNNADFVELFAQPYRVGKTNTRDEAMRAEMAETLQEMGSSGFAVLDPDDQIELLESGKGGNGYKSYDSFQDRLEKMISKIVLGHGSAIDAIEGKLGNSDEALAAVKDKEAKDNAFVENVINTKLFPKLRNLGFAIPDDVYFMFKNDKEKEEQRLKEDESNEKTATIVKTLSDAGFEVDPKYIEERTGIPVVKKPEPKPEPMKPLPGKPAKSFSKSVKNKLENLYGI